MTNLGRVLKGRDITWLTNVRIVKDVFFMYECERWTIKKALYWRFDVFKLWFWRRLLRVPWIARRSNSHSFVIKYDIKYRFSIGSTDAEAEAPVLWPLDVKNQLIGKDPDSGKDWGQVEKGTTENKMIGWHHWLNGHGFAQTPGDSEGQGSLLCCSPWDCKESDMTEQLNNK